MFSKNTTVLFATFSVWRNNKRTPINGNIEPLRDFLVPKIGKLVTIDQPLPGSEQVMPKIEMYLHGSMKFTLHKSSWYVYVLKPILELFNSGGTRISFKIRDFLSVIDWSLRDKTRFDYFIGLENVNALAGIFLRKLGRVRTVIYYVFDYSPDRFGNKLFNRLYLALDRYCATRADYIWDVSKAMQHARIEVGLNPDTSAPVIHVPIGLYPQQIQAESISKIDKHSLVYMGTLGPENGPDIALSAFALVNKKFPDASLHVIGGGGKDLAALKQISARMHLGKSVIFHGFVQSSLDMSKILRSCAIGLAPYRNIPGSPRFYADSSKIRAYFASGLAVVSSPVPPLGREAADQGAAVIAPDNAASFARAIVHIFHHPAEYLDLRKNAIMLAKYNTWEQSFTDAFRQMERDK